MTRERRAGLAAFAGGLVMALGLGLAGMTQPQKVLRFLDVTGAWDPSLAFVMLGAIPIYALAYRLVVRRAGAGPAAPHGRIDARLVAGAALFGVGWGLSGICPAPAITALPGGALPVVVFAAAMAVGMAALARATRR